MGGYGKRDWETTTKNGDFVVSISKQKAATFKQLDNQEGSGTYILTCVKIKKQ
jgi:hypothetical protein